MPVLAHDQRARLGLIANAIEHLQDLPIHQPAEGIGAARDACGQIVVHLLHDTACPLRLDAAGHARRDVLGWQAQPDRTDVVLGQRRPRRGKVRRQGLAGEDPHLERPDEALLVARHDAVGRRRVHALQHAVQVLDPARPRPRVQPGAHRVVAARAIEEALDQRAEVEARAADEDGQATTRGDVADAGRRVAGELRGRVDVGRIDDVDQVVRDATLLVRRHLVGADVEAPVDGGRVAVDDLAPVGARKTDPERTLAGGRGAEHGHQQGPTCGEGRGCHPFRVPRHCEGGCSL